MFLATHVTNSFPRKKVKGNGPNKDSAHEVHRLLETKVPVQAHNIFGPRPEPNSCLKLAKSIRKEKIETIQIFFIAHLGHRTLVNTVGGYYDTTTPDALLLLATYLYFY
ncbi:hypothetical protein Bca4012_003130 [Brassica carinata]